MPRDLQWEARVRNSHENPTFRRADEIPFPVCRRVRRNAASYSCMSTHPSTEPSFFPSLQIHHSVQLRPIAPVCLLFLREIEASLQSPSSLCVRCRQHHIGAVSSKTHLIACFLVLDAHYFSLNLHLESLVSTGRDRRCLEMDDPYDTFFVFVEYRDGSLKFDGFCKGRV